MLLELYVAESKSQVYGCLHNYFRRLPEIADCTGKIHGIKSTQRSSAMMMRVISEYIVQTQSGRTSHHTQTSLEIVVDRMHIRGHTDAWCWENCNHINVPGLDKVYTA